MGIGDGRGHAGHGEGQGAVGGGVVADGGAKASQHRIGADGEDADVAGDPEAEFQEGGEQDHQTFQPVDNPGRGPIG